ncbi:hypothetical protein H4R33_002560 [Dimargaris cristalligena]|nr:hypothetical protein H4R33_002560 [Dimargaris cristalligena]
MAATALTQPLTTANSSNPSTESPSGSPGWSFRIPSLTASIGTLYNYLPTWQSHWPSTIDKATLAERSLLSTVPLFDPTVSLQEHLDALLDLHHDHSGDPTSHGEETTGSLDDGTAAGLSPLGPHGRLAIYHSPQSAPKAYVGSVDIGGGQTIRTLAIHRPVPTSTCTSRAAKSTHDVPASHHHTVTSAAAPIVMLHGFGGGLGIYFRNYAPLAEATPQRVIYSVDWIGMGLSSRSETLPWVRPGNGSPSASSSGSSSSESETDSELGDESGSTSKGEVVAQTEDFFIDALERWRLTMGIPQMYLMAHSFGAYMAALYANRYPHRVERLVLLSPMGVSPTPPGYDAWVREILQGNFNCPLPRWAFKRPTAPKCWRPTNCTPGQSMDTPNQAHGSPETPVADMMDPMELMVGGPKSTAVPVAEVMLDTAPSDDGVQDHAADLPPDFKVPAGFRLVPLDNDPEARLHLPGAPESFLGSLRLHGPFFYHIWRWNLSPQWFVRATGPLGPTLITRFSSNSRPQSSQHTGSSRSLEPEDHCNYAEGTTTTTTLTSHSADLAQQRYLEYIYHLAAQPASGEYAYTALLTPYAFARAPLTPHRLAAVTSPVTIVYGEHDWINHGGAEELIQHLPTGSRVTYLPGARHSSMVEQPDQFNAFMREELTLTAKSESSPRP